MVLSCASKEEQIRTIQCPETFISKEHKDYFVSSNNNFDDVDYLAKINNFNNKCKQNKEGAISSILDILFVAKPINITDKAFTFYYFVSVINDENVVLDYQIFEVNKEFIIGDYQLLQETEVRESLDQYLPPIENNYYKIVIGFVLDEEKYQYLNN